MDDTGKIGIPNAIMQNPGALDAHEWDIMKTHPQIGYDILSQSNAPVFQLPAEVSLRHREKWDGSGCPGGLSGAYIPQSARIVALADVFDALNLKRSYKEAWSIEKIMVQIQAGPGKHFDPALVDSLSAILPHILEIKAKWDAAGSATGLR